MSAKGDDAGVSGDGGVVEDRPQPPETLTQQQIQCHTLGFFALITAVAVALLILIFTVRRSGCQLACGEPTLMLFAMLSGTIGGLIHSATSFATFAGNRQLRRSWLPWFYLRAPISGLLAVLVYFGARAGLLAPESLSGCAGLYTLCFLCGLTGLFSKQATAKLSDIVDSLLTPREPPKMKDGLQENGASPTAAPRTSSPEPDETIHHVQELLLALGYLETKKVAGERATSGIVDDETRVAIDAFLTASGVSVEDRRDTLGEEDGADYWTNLVDLLERALAEQGEGE